ncbi:MAG: hypothetical protein KF713_11210 [Turneriella sp.]|nr:hypothetical protein [Turneriella sp.]
MTNTDVEITVKKDFGRYLQAYRSDGLEIFMDKSNDDLSIWLNSIRRAAPRKTVFYAVGMARGLQIARAYAAQYGTAEELQEIESEIAHLVSQKVLEFEFKYERSIT